MLISILRGGSPSDFSVVQVYFEASYYGNKFRGGFKSMDTVINDIDMKVIIATRHVLGGSLQLLAKA